MTRFAFALIVSAATSGVAFGQPGNFPQPPNFGARQQQPLLSPYLNLLGGNNGNPAVNYYNFTRPFTQQPMSPFAAPPGTMLQPGYFPQQVGFLPPAQPPAYLAGMPADPNGTGSPLAPTGHPVAFGSQYTGTGVARGGGGFSPTGQQPQQRPGQVPTSTIPRAKK